MGRTGLTLKQEAFCQAYVETGNASEAYRRAYNAQNMKPETINRTAKATLDNRKIAARLAELHTEVIARHNVTIDTIRDMLVADREFAKECGTPAAAVSATLGLAKLYGLMTDKMDLKTVNGQLPAAVTLDDVS